ncbi:TetR/AcrR family transcriptional regulator [Pseudomonas sp. NA-150]|uniref:TetR/AcrR family transcriptional regulator n=1 Tax=Pseudomonas sp. NA-150 TaxID=3367525 RepID=UPI0037C7A609
MKENLPQTPRKTGRPLSFDRALALDAAMRVFWSRGYEAASISDLIAAMGITPPSLYTAFGDKQRLFLEAVHRYQNRPGLDLHSALDNAPTARDAVRLVLFAAAVQQTRSDLPQGCLLMSAAVTSPPANEVHQAIVQLRQSVETSLKARIQRGIDEGELPAGSDAAALAGFYLTVIQGMSVQARDGAGRDKLQSVAEAALRAWPT